MVPENGRITIDPLEKDGYEGSADESHTKPSDANNTRFVGLAIHNTAEKEVLFRLASGTAARGTADNTLIKTYVDSKYATKHDTVSNGLFASHWSSPRYASIITLDFTDNMGSSDTARYTIDGIEKTYPWHPDKWDKMDLFVQSSGPVSANLVFGPFGHKDGITMDYHGNGNFQDSYHGADGELAREWPGLSTANQKNKGLPIFPVDFGVDAHFWFLDSPTYQVTKDSTTVTYSSYVWFMQGVNILGGTDPEERSSIYSTRAVVIGGALIRSSTSHTTDGLNRALDGFADQSVTTAANYVEATTRYSQLIYNTDIILMPPSGDRTAYSLIRRPNTWKDRTNLPSSTGTDAQKKAYAKDTGFNPTVTIVGGTIYVGERQYLSIQGSQNRAGDYQNGNNLWVSPDKIVVAKGGTLHIQESYFTNIFTDIYVDGGTLIIDEGAKIKGNIYAYNGGKVNIQGSFKLLSPHDDGNDNVLTEAEAKDGILIYGDQLVGRVDGITAPGILILPAVGPNDIKITGSSNKVHILGTVDGTTVKNPNLQAFTDEVLGLIKEKLLCMGRNPTTGTCTHFGFLSGEWIGGVFMHG
jgi:hypothetical protein